MCQLAAICARLLGFPGLGTWAIPHLGFHGPALALASHTALGPITQFQATLSRRPGFFVMSGDLTPVWRWSLEILPLTARPGDKGTSSYAPRGRLYRCGTESPGALRLPQSSQVRSRRRCRLIIRALRWLPLSPVLDAALECAAKEQPPRAGDESP